MRISYNFLKEFVDLDITPNDVAKTLTSLGFEVEEIFDFGQKYQNIVIGEVLVCDKISDKLTFCKVSDGKNIHEVVCGAPNVAHGQKVVLALPGAIIPKNNVVIKPTTIRGYNSNGMICSEDELEIGDCNTEILVMNQDAPIGKNFGEYFGLNDVVFEIAVTPNRGDCLSHLGIARELSAYFNLPLKIPYWEAKESSTDKIEDLVSIEILDANKCPRYSARIVRNITVSESPNWLKSRLILLGLRPINAIVDVTNYVMMELGQPLHAFDYDKLAGKKIIVRTAVDGEKFVTLDGKERTLDSTMLMICDAEKPVAIGGVMGGENSEITPATRNVLLESAYFNPVSIRRTSKKLGLTSDSSYRFERGVDYNNIVFALNRAANLIAMLGNGELVAGYIDIYPAKIFRKFVSFRFDRARKIIGSDIPNERMEKILTNLGFKVEKRSNERILFEVPSYRFDVEQEIDLIEDIARFYGYDNIPQDRSFTISYSGYEGKTLLDVPELRQKIKDYFVARGFTEILTQNLYSPKKTLYFCNEEMIEIENPLGEEYSIVRPSIFPLILEVAKYNINVGKKDIRFFEIGKEFKKNVNSQKFIEGIEEREVLAIAISGQKYPLQWGFENRKVDFYDLKGIVEHFFASFKIDNFEIVGTTDKNEIFTSEYSIIKINGRTCGEFGLISSRIKKLFDLEEDIYLFSLDLEPIYTRQKSVEKYEKISPFPVIRRDLAFVVADDVLSFDMLKVIWENGGEFLRDVQIFDVYKGKNIGEGRKNLAFALFFNSHERTLTDEEVQEAINRIVDCVTSQFKAEIRIF